MERMSDVVTAPAPAVIRTPLTYKDSGVDIDAGDEVVDRIKGLLKRTHGPRVMGQHGAFAGMFRLDYNQKLFKNNYRDPVLVGCTDGVGTKVLLAAERKIYDTVGIDCVAMNVNDLIVQGAEPLFFLDYLGLSKLDPEATAKRSCLSPPGFTPSQSSSSCPGTARRRSSAGWRI